mmetsp:Transcript_920/g.2520  ORF Transcript_920/g.2520 Transcript_920/m.2520 type:complete len:88 (+) Transcript_920:3-266(+)
MIKSFLPERASQALLIQMVLDLTAVAWSFAYVQHLGDDLHAAIRGLAVGSGRELDKRALAWKMARQSRVLPMVACNVAAELPRLELC